MHLKKMLLLVVTLSYCLQAHAQFTLSGKVLNDKGKSTLVVNIPLVHGTYAANDIKVPIANDGSFNINLPINEPKFVALVFNNHKYQLLLQPLKNLTINLSASTNSMAFVSGTALPVNQLMQDINYLEAPFFLNGHDDTNRDNFNNLSFDQLVDKVVKPYNLQQEAKLNMVKAAVIGDVEKQIIAEEIKYRADYLLYLLAVTAKLEKPAMDSLILAIFNDTKLSHKAYIAGSFAYDFLEGYLRYIQTKAFIQVKKENIAPNQPLPYYGISIDSAKALVKQNGEPYGLWLSCINVLPLEIVEPYIYQQIVALYHEKRLMNLLPLANAFITQFPNSKYKASIQLYMVQLKAQLAKNQNNANIKVFTGYEKAISIYDVIKPLKGKVVYLDVWGTWCGPCKEELAYIPDLRARFKNKDVAYVYLDLDDDHLDLQWKEFIKANNMEGLHLRKTRQSMSPFWKELLANAKDKAEYYPQYFIFDKAGKLVVSKANRPSAKEELYRQIEKFLD